MQIIKPSFYDKFICTADKCPNTCCKNWKIEIDQSTYNKYQTIHAPIGNKLRKNTIRYVHTSNPTFFAFYKLKDKVCPFLSQDKLCSIYSELTEEYMCTTCRMFPRLINNYNGLCEKTLDTACPEVIKFLISTELPYSFDIVEEELTSLEKNYMNIVSYNDNFSFIILLKTRTLFIELIQQRTIPFWKRIVLLKIAEDQIQSHYENKDYSLLDTTINSLSFLHDAQSLILQLDTIKPSNKVKINTLTTIFQNKCEHGIGNSDFLPLLKDLNTFYASCSTKKMDDVMNTFDSYLSCREYIFENLIVHELCMTILKATTNKELTLQVSNIILRYALLKQLLLSQWYLNDYSISDEQLVHVIHLFSREFLHDTTFAPKFNQYIEENGYTQLNNLFHLIR